MENGEWRIFKNTPTRMDFNSQFSILNSVSRLAFFQPIAVLAAATLASFVDPDEFRDCFFGARYDRQENPRKQFHGPRPLQLTGYQFPRVDVQLQTFRLVQ
jgi:hypothetical protein